MTRRSSPARSWSAAVVLLVAACGRGGSDDGPDGGGGVLALPLSIHTVAGRGAPGYDGEGLPARESGLFWPDDVVLDPEGRLLVMDWNNHRVRRRDAAGALETIVGAGLPGDTAGPALDCLLNHPTNAAFDASGRMVVACWHNHKLKRLEADGTVTVVAGGAPGFAGDGGPATDALLDLPSSVLATPDGALLVLDTGNQRLRRIDAEGIITTVAGTGAKGYTGDGGPALLATFAFPDDGAASPGGKMCFDREGRVLIADAGNHVVRRIEGDGTIVTVAGSGVPGFSGDGGPATAAQLKAPVDVACGADGSVFIADRDNDRVRVVRPDGTIDTFAGGHVHAPGTGEHGHSPFAGDGGPAKRASLRKPSGIELDAHGNLYIADRDNHTIRVVVSRRPGPLVLPPRPPGQEPDPDPGIGPVRGVPGTIDTLVGTGRSGFNGDGFGGLKTDLYAPVAVAVRPGTGELVVSDWNNHRIRQVRAQDGLVVSIVGNGFPGDSTGHSEDIQVFHPTGIAFAADGDALALASWHGYRVKVHSYAADETLDVAGTGVASYSGDGGPATAAGLDLPSSVAYGPDGSLYVADEANARVRRVRPDGVIETFAGDGTPGFAGDGGPATSARLAFSADGNGRPTSFLAADGDGRVFIADTGNHRVRVVDLDGTIRTIAGNGVAGFEGDGGPATAASLSSPVGLAVDADGTVFIADRDNHAIRRVAPDGTITTVAGTGSAGFSGDGGLAAAAALNEPHGLAVDDGGNLYVADLGNHRVRVIWGARDTWKRVVFPFLQATCGAAACHGTVAGGGLRFEEEQAAWTDLVNAPASTGGWTRVVPFNAGASLLYQKVDPSGPIPGDRMPQGSLPLSARDLAVLRAWIEAGAER